MEDKIKIHFVETKTIKSPQSNLKNMIWETISEPTPILFAHGEQTNVSPDTFWLAAYW